MQGLVGDDNEATTLLAMLAERYKQLGHGTVAINLLRRATALTAHPTSVTHLEGLLDASLALGRGLAADGVVEEAIAQLTTVSAHALPRAAAGHSGAAAAVVRIRAIRKAAASEAVALLRRHGREREAARVLADQGSRDGARPSAASSRVGADAGDGGGGGGGGREA